jgi:drug/metabolite transporter (DMT)-like permease
MAIAQHRAPIDYTVPLAWAAVLALAVGVVAGFTIGVVAVPDGQGVSRGLILGLALGVPAAVAVVFSRRAVDQGAQPWLVTALGLAVLVLVAALLFGLTQFDVSMAPVGAGLGVATGAISLGVGLWLAQRRERTGDPQQHRRH